MSDFVTRVQGSAKKEAQDFLRGRLEEVKAALLKAPDERTLRVLQGRGMELLDIASLFGVVID